jgi:hypothetical protein
MRCSHVILPKMGVALSDSYQGSLILTGQVHLVATRAGPVTDVGNETTPFGISILCCECGETGNLEGSVWFLANLL